MGLRAVGLSPVGKPIVAMRGNHYASVDGVKRGVHAWVKQTPAFFEKSIMDLVSRWQKCIASDGDC